MKLEFSGSPMIKATREGVWDRLLDPDFVAASTPGLCGNIAAGTKWSGKSRLTR